MKTKTKKSVKKTKKKTKKTASKKSTKKTKKKKLEFAKPASDESDFKVVPSLENKIKKIEKDEDLEEFSGFVQNKNYGKKIAVGLEQEEEIQDSNTGTRVIGGNEEKSIEYNASSGDDKLYGSNNQHYTSEIAQNNSGDLRLKSVYEMQESTSSPGGNVNVHQTVHRSDIKRSENHETHYDSYYEFQEKSEKDSFDEKKKYKYHPSG